MKLKRLKKSKKGRIEIIPMIDIMFFLLATFMLASLVAQRHFESLNVDLAQGKAAKLNDNVTITLMIDAKNHLFLNDVAISEEALFSKMKPLLVDNKSVIIASDKKAQQGVVVGAMLKAREAGAEHFSFLIKN